MSDEVAYTCNGANLAKRTLDNPEEASGESVKYIGLCERFRLVVHKIEKRNNPLEYGLVARENDAMEMPPTEQQEELCMAFEALVEDLEEGAKTYEESLKVSNITYNKFTSPTQHMTDEYYMQKWLMPRVESGKTGLFCGLTLDSLKEMIEVEGPEMARKKYQATVWAKKKFEAQDMPTTPEEALKLHTKHLTLQSTSKKVQGAASKTTPDVEISFKFEDWDSTQTKKTFLVAKGLVGALRTNTEVKSHNNIISAASEVLSASTASDMKFADFIDGVWKRCSGDVEGRGNDIPSIKANFASANNTLTRAHLLLLVCRPFQLPKDAVAAKVEYKDLSIKLSALKKNLSSRTTQAVALDLSAEKAMTTENGKDRVDGAITAAVPAADVLECVQATVTAAADDDDKQDKGGDVDMVPSTAVPAPVSPREQYNNGGPTNGPGLGIGKGLMMKRPASPTSQHVGTLTKRFLRSSALGGGQ